MRATCPHIFLRTMKGRVLVAMSGGVDSSVAALLLKRAGYEVIGISMQLWDYSEKEDQPATQGSCCSPEDMADARRVAHTIGIPFYVLNMEEVFSKEVVDYFVKSYLRGETPNPCVKCNSEIKFNVLIKRAFELGAQYIATGHYARIRRDAQGRYHLLKGVDRGKDQSYFLFSLTQKTMAHVLFPVGELTKAEVRSMARQAGLKVSEKAESQEICFVEDRNYRNLLAEYAPQERGRIVDTEGNLLGYHTGLFRYTIGQRRGLNIRNGMGPYYVVSMDREKNELIVGKEDELLSEGLYAREINWIMEPPHTPIRVEARIRYRHSPVSAIVTPHARDSALVRFSTPQRAVTPGQAVVFYRGDEVIGGGWIERAVKEFEQDAKELCN